MTSKTNYPIYHWAGISMQGRKLSGEIQAADKSTAYLQLKNQNILITHVRKKLFCQWDFKNSSIPTILFVFFFRQLSTLIAAGIPIIQSLIILKKSHRNSAFQNILSSIKVDIEAGKVLASCLRKFPRYFDSCTCQLIQVGEQTGTLTIMLSRIANHKEKMLSLKMKMIQSLFYPVITLIVAATITVIMLVFVVPRFADLFQTLHGTLPTLTVFIINLSHYARQIGWLIPPIIFSLILSLKWLSKSGYLKQTTDNFIFKIPIIGKILSKINLARFARTLAIALNAGMPMTDALKLIAESSDHHFYSESIFWVQAEIVKGIQLHKAMQMNLAFPDLLIQMVKIGEESGTIDQMLEKFAEIYEDAIEHTLTNLTHALEPLIMIILGVLIGGLVIAMYLPIFKLGTLM